MLSDYNSVTIGCVVTDVRPSRLSSVILKSLRLFSYTIRDRFLEPFEHQIWNNFFHCAISFLTQVRGRGRGVSGGIVNGLKWLKPLSVP